MASKPFSKMKRWKIVEIVGVKKAEPKTVKKEKVESKIVVKSAVKAKKPARKVPSKKL